MKARARNKDPRTSHKAASSVESNGTAKAQRAKCLAYVILSPGRTAAEIAKAIGLERHAPSRRLPELRLARKVENRSSRICTVTGRDSLTWYVKPKEDQKRLF